MILIGGLVMCFYIGIEDLAANALIALLSKQDRRFVSYEELEKYGETVVKVLNEQGEQAILILSRESTNAMFRNYSDIFEEYSDENGVGISLQKDITVDNLIDRFRGYLAWDVLLAFVNEESLRKLGVA